MLLPVPAGGACFMDGEDGGCLRPQRPTLQPTRQKQKPLSDPFESAQSVRRIAVRDKEQSAPKTMKGLTLHRGGQQQHRQAGGRHEDAVWCMTANPVWHQSAMPDRRFLVESSHKRVQRTAAKAERSGVPTSRGGGGGGGLLILVSTKFGTAKCGAEKIWHQFLNATGNFWYKIPGLWHNKRRMRIVVVISYGALVGCRYFLPKGP